MLMRSLSGWLVLMLVWVGVVVPGAAAQRAAQAERIAATLDRGRLGPGGAVVVHYHRPEGDYEGWNLWSWSPGAEGRAFPFAGRTAFGRYAVVPVGRGVERQGFIIRRGEWADRDVEGDRFVRLAPGEASEVWVVSGDQRVYTEPGEIDLTARIVGAFLDGSDFITLTATAPLDEAQRGAAGVLRRGEAGVYGISSFERAPGRSSGRVVYRVTLDGPVAFGDVASLSIAFPGTDGRTVYAREVLTEDRFTALDAELGPEHSALSTVFRVWSPVSESVHLLLYETPDAPAPAREVAMTHTGRGVWEAEIAGDLHGTAYQYRYRSYGRDRVAADIHCRGATADSSRSVVVDLSRTNPPGWGLVDPPRLAQATDEVIYEVHVRDFTVADPTIDESRRGTYLGLVHEGSFEVDGRRVLTGMAHLKELGVTAVHLLPVQDFTAPIGQYNWGYWTALFNVPESNYSTDPHEPVRAITELKSAVHRLHSAGIRVILDVVYNHTSSSGEYSPFDQSVPFYYFRTTPDGRLTNDAGVGNSMADERPMVRKYISDSLAFWTSEYRVDGFRFDLIGTHEPESVRAWVDRLRGMREDLTIYGEPWTGGGPVRFGKGAQRGMRLAVFNDHLRNAVRGDLDGTATGFATGPGGDHEAVRRGVMGAIDDFTDHPTETINYVSAHDNLTFWDKLLLARPRASEAQKRAMQRLAHGIVLTSQGIAFVHAGAEFARTKGGNHNSYDAGDEVNKLDWARKAAYADVFGYMRGLIEMRRAHPAFRMASAEQVRANLRFLPRERLSEPSLVAFLLDGRAVGDAWGEILVAYNGEERPASIDLPSGRWDVVVDDREAGTRTLRRVSGRVTLPVYSMVVLKR